MRAQTTDHDAIQASMMLLPKIYMETVDLLAKPGMNHKTNSEKEQLELAEPVLRL